MTSKNLKQAEEQISSLKEVNQEQKEEIYRLKEELSKKESKKMETSKDDVSGYRNIKDSIDLITRGLQRKENTDMKQIIGEIFKIRKIVCEKVDDTYE